MQKQVMVVIVEKWEKRPYPLLVRDIYHAISVIYHHQKRPLHPVN